MIVLHHYQKPKHCAHGATNCPRHNRNCFACCPSRFPFLSKIKKKNNEVKPLPPSIAHGVCIWCMTDVCKLGCRQNSTCWPFIHYTNAAFLCCKMAAVTPTHITPTETPCTSRRPRARRLCASCREDAYQAQTAFKFRCQTSC